MEIDCLHLAFYLSSWGMMRASSFLLQKDLYIHEYLIRNVVMDQSNNKFRMSLFDKKVFLGSVDNLILTVKKSYMENIRIVNGTSKKINVSDTLASKIILGIYGCVPAYDRFFIKGLKLHKIVGNDFNSKSLRKLVLFHNTYADDFKRLEKELNERGNDYPLMKLVDMYFWQCGYDAENENEVVNLPTFEVSKNIDGEVYQKKTSNVVEARDYIRKIIETAKIDGKDFVDIKSGQIHKKLGYHNRMPTVCGAMESIPEVEFLVVHDTSSGMSSTKVFRYLLK
jgi:hypothetical protein